MPAFPVEVLPGWLGEYVAAVATATQTPPDLAGMLALAVLATVAAGAVEVEPRPGWREPLCLFIAVGMDAGSRKSGVFTAMTRPVADFERDQAAAALPGITETAVLRRIADQAAAPAEAAASKAPASQQEEPGPRPSPGPPKPPTSSCRRCPGGWSMTPPPRPWPGCWPPTAASPCLSPEGDVFDQMAGRYNQAAGPNLGVYLKGHAGDLLKVDRRGRPPEYVERPCLTIGLAVQPEVLRGLAGRPGFGGRGLLARFLYSLPQSLVGRRQPGAPPVPQAVADRYALELQALAASLTTPGRRRGPGPADPRPRRRASCCSGFERDLEPRLAAGSGDLAHLAGWAAKLAGATCRLAALLHLASHLRDGWAHPISADTFAAAIRLADYLVEHARAVFDLMGADPRVDDARWLLDWISRTNQTQFSRRDAHLAAPRGRFPKATDLDPALALLEEHGYLRRVDADPPAPRVADPPPRGSSSTPCTPHRTHRTHKTSPAGGFCGFCRFCGAWRHPGEPPMRRARLSRYPTRTAPAAPGHVRSRAHAASGRQRPACAPRRPSPPNAVRRSLRGGPDGLGELAQARQPLPGLLAAGRRLPRRQDRRHPRRGPRPRRREAPGDAPRHLARTPARPAAVQRLGGRVVGDVGGRPTQPHHPRRHRKPAAAACAALVRRPADRQDHPGRRAPLASATGRARSGRQRWPTAARWRCGSSSSPWTKARSTPTRSARCPPPKRRVDPEQVFGEVKRRALTPEEAGRLLACFPLFWWDHVITLLGTGLRFGELAGLRRRRVHLNRPMPVLEVGPTRYQAGRFGSGFKPRPKSDAGIRPVPLAPLVVEAIRRQLPPGSDPDDLVFTGPGGGPGHRGGPSVPRGTRTVLSRHNFHRTYHGAVAKLADPAVPLRPTARRVLRALRDGGPQPSTSSPPSSPPPGRRPIRPATVGGCPARAGGRRPGGGRRRRPGRAGGPVDGAAGRP